MTDIREPDCDEVVEVVTAHLEGLLPEGQREALERHLESCPGCVTYVQHMRVLVASLGTVGREDLSPETREGLMEAFRGWRSA